MVVVVLLLSELCCCAFSFHFETNSWKTWKELSQYGTMHVQGPFRQEPDLVESMAAAAAALSNVVSSFSLPGVDA